MKTLDSQEIEGLVRDLFRSLTEDQTPAPVFSLDYHDLELQQQEIMADEEIKALSAEIATRQFGAETEGVARRLSASVGAEFDMLTPLRQQQLSEGVARALRERARYTLFRQTTTLDPFLPIDPLFGTRPVQSIANSPVLQTALPPELGNQSGTGGSMAERIAMYLKTGDWTDKTRDEKAGVLAWFEEFIGPETDVRMITGDDVIGFMKAVKHLRKHAKTGGSFEAAQTTVKEHRVGLKTAKKKLDTAKAFLNWLEMMGAIQSVPAKSIRFKKTKTPKSKARRTFVSDELGVLFSSPLYSGYANPKKRYIPGELLERDDHFWMPLILLYTGMRLAEPLQIAAQDVHLESDYPYFDLDLEKLKLKEEVSDRFVPIHPDLIEFGFLDFVKQRQKSGGAERLFRRIVSKGEVGNYYSQWLGRYLDRVGLTDPRLVAHSLRHGFKDALRNAGVPDGEQRFIMGHSSSDAADHYGSGADLDVLWKYVAKLDLKLPQQIKTDLSTISSGGF